METLNNKIFEFNNLKIKAVIEYYDYSKSRNSLIQELNNPDSKVRKNNNPYQGQNFIKSTGQARKNNNKVPYNKFQNQNKAYSNNSNFQNVSKYNYFFYFIIGFYNILILNFHSIKGSDKPADSFQRKSWWI